jgi:hypothetical protein
MLPCCGTLVMLCGCWWAVVVAGELGGLWWWLVCCGAVVMVAVPISLTMPPSLAWCVRATRVLAERGCGWALGSPGVTLLLAGHHPARG